MVITLEAMGTEENKTHSQILRTTLYIKTMGGKKGVGGGSQ